MQISVSTKLPLEIIGSYNIQKNILYKYNVFNTNIIYLIQKVSNTNIVYSIQK